MDSEYIITYDGELYHWGIKGMKWGVRRYQNPDGSLTSAGRKRYIGSDGNLTKAGKKYYAKESERLRNERKVLNAKQRSESKLAKLEEMRKANNEKKGENNPEILDKTKKKSVKDMTDQELNSAINRARMEDQYNQLRPEKTKDPKFKKLMDKFVNDAVIPATVDAGKKAMTKMVDNMLKDKVNPNSYEALKKTYDLLKVKSDIENLKNPKTNWDDEQKKYRFEREKTRDAKKDAEEAAKEAERRAKDPKQKAKWQAEYDEYNKPYTDNSSYKSEPYRQSGGEKTYYNPTIAGLLDSGSSLSRTPVSNIVDARDDGPARSFASSYYDTPVKSLPSPNISGYLPAPKDRDD